LNRLRRRAAWLALSQAVVEKEFVKASELFGTFTVTAPDAFKELPVMLGDLAEERRTERQALFRLPLLPVVEADSIRFIESAEAVEFWKAWMKE
jgi:hypothetical protein